jgi:hypothetical protein
MILEKQGSKNNVMLIISNTFKINNPSIPFHCRLNNYVKKVYKKNNFSYTNVILRKYF